MATDSKRKALTLNQKVEAIKLLESGKPAYKIAQEFGVGKTQIQNLRKRKAEVLNDFDSNVSGSSKRRRHLTGNEEVNQLCLEWFKDASRRRINVTGPLLKEKALQFAADIGNTTFKASNGWIESFNKRNNLVYGTMSGERGDVNQQTVNDWKSKLPGLCDGFESNNIFNMDETGLFFKDTSRNTFYQKGEDCAGGKRSKERITVLLCSSMLGEKMKPMVIGKSRQPRCFNRTNPDNLPVIYRSNKKAWMTSKLYEEYLQFLNTIMKRQKRKILLFVDNAPCHPDTKYSNVEVKFLPPNTTSFTQPMDQGIIQATKLKFRKKQLFNMMKEMDGQPEACGSDLLKQITVLDAIYWIFNAWNDVQESTIIKCFRKCGFGETEVVIENSECSENDNIDDNIPLAAIKMTREIFGCEFRELLEIDSNVRTCETETNINWDKPAPELLQELKQCDNDSDSECDDELEELDKKAILSKSEANEMILKLKEFAMKKGAVNMLTYLTKAEEELCDMFIVNCRQTELSDYFVSRTDS